MRVAYVLPGSGDAFYCENCIRDLGVIRALRGMGCDVMTVPMYLPVAGVETVGGGRVFFGAVSTYLSQRLRFLSRSRGVLRRALDSRPVLGVASRLAGSTRTTGLEDMTLAMLDGEAGAHLHELEELAAWLRREVRPDIIHLSNGLLIGLARLLHEHTGARVVCSLQDEHTWIEPMEKGFAERAWQVMRGRLGDVDVFVPVSRYYAEFMRVRLGVDPERMRVVRVGVATEGYSRSSLPLEPAVLGYLARLSRNNGLDRLISSYLQLRRRRGMESLVLRVAGGATGDDRSYARAMARRIRFSGAKHDVVFEPKYSGSADPAMLASLTVLSVPRDCGEALGMFVLEAMASGVPVVEPACGGFVEIMEETGGGVLYDPTDPEGLTRSLWDLLSDRSLLHTIADRGYRAVRERFTNARMAEDLLAVYREVLGGT